MATCFADPALKQTVAMAVYWSYTATDSGFVRIGGAIDKDLRMGSTRGSSRGWVRGSERCYKALSVILGSQLSVGVLGSVCLSSVWFGFTLRHGNRTHP